VIADHTEGIRPRVKWPATMVTALRRDQPTRPFPVLVRRRGTGSAQLQVVPAAAKAGVLDDETACGRIARARPYVDSEATDFYDGVSRSGSVDLVGFGPTNSSVHRAKRHNGSLDVNSAERQLTTSGNSGSHPARHDRKPDS